MQFLTENFIALLPIIIISVIALLVMLAIAGFRNHNLTFGITVAGLNLALVTSLILIFTIDAVVISELFIFDKSSYFYGLLILISSLACATLMHAYFGARKADKGYPGNREEIYLLLLLSTVGGLSLVSASNLAALFVSLELISVPVYGMVAYAFFNKKTLEAGIKYMVLSALGSAFLIFGMALMYVDAGSMNFEHIGYSLNQVPSLVSQLGFVLLLTGVAFKLSLAPFHLWTADVYQGAPAPVTAFLATASKVAVIIAFMRLLQLSEINSQDTFSILLVILAVFSILAGNILALLQNNLKRLLGYSSIAHFGYILIALLVEQEIASEAIAVYLATYVLTSIGTFGVITLMSTPYSGRDADALYEYRGLFWRRPYLTAVLTTMLLSLAGIPMTAGFIGKFYVIAAAVAGKQWLLLAALIVGSAIAVYYYLRVIVTMYLQETSIVPHDAPTHWAQYAGGIMLLITAILVVVLGVYPTPMINLINFVLV